MSVRFGLPIIVASLAAPPTLQAQTHGDMDGLFGPATAVNQGMGMTSEITRALAPGPEHAMLARLIGEWAVSGVSGRNRSSVAQRAVVTEMFGGAWFELKLFEANGDLARMAHFGFDGYRDSFAMWEIGAGFTSPQARVGEMGPDGRALQYHRRYTIRRRDELVPVVERVVLTFRDDGAIRWESYEIIGDQEARMQKDVLYTRASRP